MPKIFPNWRQTQIFEIIDSENIIFENLTFFATTIKAEPSCSTSCYNSNLTFNSIKFLYPSTNKRMIKDLNTND
jgi:hypothetical protein